MSTIPPRRPAANPIRRRRPDDRPTLPGIYGPSSPPPRRHPAHEMRATSVEAYHRVVLPSAGTQSARVLAALRGAGPDGLTQWELHEVTGIMYSSLARPIGDLIRSGLAARTTRTRPSASGGHGYVIVVVDHHDRESDQ